MNKWARVARPDWLISTTLATSLFPDRPRENAFFVDGPRKIFAYLLTLKPTSD